MFELNGKYNSCKVFTDNCDNETISQLTALLNQESVKGSRIRIMPDTHAGKGSVIGTTMTISDKVIPNIVGVDIGCFTGDTEVWCSAGYYKPIKDLVDNGRFMTDSYDFEVKGFVICGAVAKKTRENAPLVRVNYGGHSVRCTPDHQFLVSTNSSVYYDSDETELKWIEAKDLKEGMRLVAEDARVIVKSVEELTETEDVYCLTVEDTHNFTIKGGIIVHNCGMTAVKLKEKRVDLPKLDSVIRKYVPSGYEVHDEPICEDSPISGLRCAKYVNLNRAMKSLGTLGGGNHFIEVDKDSDDNLWLVVHTGSRHLGIEVCDYYQDLGYKRLSEKASGGSLKEKSDELIKKLKSEGRDKEISKSLEKLRAEYKASNISIPQALAYVEGQDFDDYLHDMDLVQQHAVINRMTIVRQIIKNMKLHVVDEFTTIHNYIDVENMILRKGSVSAQLGEKLIIPMNMRDGSLICIGKGNPDWNYSAPHGAGRLMSRSQAKESISMSDFKKSMEGIYSTSVSRSTIDESPMVYKPMQEIIDNIKDTVDIVDIIKPIYNFKAGEESK